MKKSLLVILLMMSSCTWVNQKLGLKQDHELEEICEQIIEQETTLSLDLSTSSPE